MRSKFFALVIVLSLILTACGTATGTTPKPADTAKPAATTEPAAPEAKTLRIFFMDYTPDQLVWFDEELNPAFEAEHPGVTVEVTTGNWGTWTTQYEGFFAVGAGPDIINLGSEMSTLYGSYLADMSSYFDNWADLSQFNQSALEAAKFEGKLRGLPMLVAPRFINCRTDLMTAGGWTTGTPKSLAEWVTFAGQLSKKNADGTALAQQALIPVAENMADWQWYYVVLASLGGSFTTADGAAAFDSPENAATMKWMLDMRQATFGAAADQVGLLPTGVGSRIDKQADGTENGGVCLWHSGWAMPAAGTIWDSIKSDAFYGDPAFAGGSPVVLAFNDWLAVPEYSQNKAEAADWIKMFLSKENNNKYNSAFNFLPVRADSQYGYIVDNALLAAQKDLYNQYGLAFAGIPKADKLSTIMQDVLGQLVTEALTPADALAKIQADYTAALTA